MIENFVAGCVSSSYWLCWWGWLSGEWISFANRRYRLEFTDTALQTIAGDRIDLAVLSQQRPLLIYVWATWCGICRYTTPAVEKLAKEGGNVVSVALRSGDDEKLARWMHKKS